jgi:hypothetical protein
MIVANCHQMPSDKFGKRILYQQEVIEALSRISAHFQRKNLVYTVSPVRHSRQGLQWNQVSKSNLRLAIFMLDLPYFPSYEIVVDELRDYQWFEQDGVHPNQQTVEFIYEKFKSTFFSEASLQRTTEWQKLKSRITHKPKYPGSAQHKKFVEQLRKDLSESEFAAIRKKVGMLKN